MYPRCVKGHLISSSTENKQNFIWIARFLLKRLISYNLFTRPKDTITTLTCFPRETHCHNPHHGRELTTQKHHKFGSCCSQATIGSCNCTFILHREHHKSNWHKHFIEFKVFFEASELCEFQIFFSCWRLNYAPDI